MLLGFFGGYHRSLKNQLGKKYNMATKQKDGKKLNIQSSLRERQTVRVEISTQIETILKEC